MAGFVGRREELRVLEDAYERPGSALIPLYGRRRVGKSELILHFLKDRPGIYFLGKQAPAGMQLHEFLGEAATVLQEPLLAGLSAESWAAALDAVVSRWRPDRKLILAFDEFQWMVGASPELPSVLQERWDRSWRHTGNVFLILCGSYIGFMEREVLGKKSPLFGRRTAQILLRPSVTAKPPSSTPDTRAPTRPGPISSAAASRSTCSGSPTAARSSPTSPPSCSTSTPLSTARPTSFCGKSCGRSLSTSPSSRPSPPAIPRSRTSPASPARTPGASPTTSSNSSSSATSSGDTP